MQEAISRATKAIATPMIMIICRLASLVRLAASALARAICASRRIALEMSITTEFS